MPIVIAIVGAIAAAYFFVMRARNAAEMTQELIGVANDVRLAARRFGFHRHKNTHPADSIEDPNLAVASIALAFTNLSGLPTKEDRERLKLALRKTLNLSDEGAEEALILGTWIVDQCNGASPAISRVSRNLFKMNGLDSWQTLLATIKGSIAPGAQMTPQQSEALQEIQITFRVK